MNPFSFFGPNAERITHLDKPLMLLELQIDELRPARAEAQQLVGVLELYKRSGWLGVQPNVQPNEQPSYFDMKNESNM